VAACCIRQSVRSGAVAARIGLSVKRPCVSVTSTFNIGARVAVTDRQVQRNNGVAACCIRQSVRSGAVAARIGLSVKRPCVSVTSTFNIGARVAVTDRQVQRNNGVAACCIRQSVRSGAVAARIGLSVKRPCVSVTSTFNTGTDVESACDTYTWPLNGQTYTSSNSTATHTLTNAAGCDSVVTLNLTIRHSNTGTDVESACDTYTWPLNGQTYTSSNSTATHTLTNAAGCDSVVTLNLTIRHSNTGTDVESACDTYTWPLNGQTYTSSNSTATHTLTNAAGCDSVVTLNLTIRHSNTGTDVESACDTYTWPLNGQTYTSSNSTATHTLTNAAGCDSVVTLNLTIRHSNTGTDVESACDTYTWPLNGQTYTSSNSTATHTLTNAAGCDSVVTLNLTIRHSNTGTDVESACDTYTWPLNGQTYTSSNSTATHTLTN